MSKDEYLITDAPLKALTVFAMPMILGSFFQQVYNMADSIIVGQFVGSSALAAVGACVALTNVFICVALGAGVGAGVLVSRYFGAQNYSKMKTIVSTSLISFLILSILLGFFGFGFSHFMMSLLQTPADILDEAVLYLRVYFVGFPFLFMYNILSTMFNSIGESKIPLGLLIFSSVLNIVMDLWMVAGLDELDQKIIRLLIENARISYSDIGEETGISRVAVKARIQALEKRGVIEEYTTIINPQKISGAVSCYFEIETKPEYLAQVTDILYKNDTVTQIYRVTGRDRLHVHAVASSGDEMEYFLHNVIDTLPGIISCSCNMILSRIKDIKGLRL